MTIKELYGKRCLHKVGKEDFSVLVFDWDAVKGKSDFLDDIFGDCDIPGDYPELVDRDDDDRIVWKSKSLRPFAFYNVQDEDAKFTRGNEYPQFSEIWLVDGTSGDSPIYAIDVDGTAVPAKKPKKRAPSLEKLNLRVAVPTAKQKEKPGGPNFDEVRPRLKAGKLNGEAIEILASLTGDEDGGAGYATAGAKPPKKVPSGRDPRWIAALGEELTAAIVLASDSNYQGDPRRFAGALMSFGPDAVPTIAKALADAVEKYPGRSLNFGCQGPFWALLAFKSAAGVPAALALIDKAVKPDKMRALDCAIEYLGAFPGDPRVLPALKALRPKLKGESNQRDTLERVLGQLG